MTMPPKKYTPVSLQIPRRKINISHAMEAAIAESHHAITALRERHMGLTSVDEDMPVVSHIIHQLGRDIGKKISEGVQPMDAVAGMKWDDFAHDHPRIEKHLLDHISRDRLHATHMETPDEKWIAEKAYFDIAKDAFKRQLKKTMITTPDPATGRTR
jgi:hypothetical protein